MGKLVKLTGQMEDVLRTVGEKLTDVCKRFNIEVDEKRITELIKNNSIKLKVAELFEDREVRKRDIKKHKFATYRFKIIVDLLNVTLIDYLLEKGKILKDFTREFNPETKDLEVKFKESIKKLLLLAGFKEDVQIGVQLEENEMYKPPNNYGSGDYITGKLQIVYKEKTYETAISTGKRHTLLAHPIKLLTDFFKNVNFDGWFQIAEGNAEYYVFYSQSTTDAALLKFYLEFDDKNLDYWSDFGYSLFKSIEKEMQPDSASVNEGVIRFVKNMEVIHDSEMQFYKNLQERAGTGKE